MKFLIAFFVSMIAVNVSAAQGTDVGFMVGIKNADFDTDTTNTSYDSLTGLMGGVIAKGELGSMSFRTGGYYVQRIAEITVANSSADIEIAYLDVPLTLMYNFNDMLGVFGGTVFGLKVSDDCSGSTEVCASVDDLDIKSLYAAATFGVHASFHPNWAGEIFYEFGLIDIADETSANALSAGLIFIY